MSMFQRASAALLASLVAAGVQASTVNVGVDTSRSWLSYATVYELPSDPAADRGAFVYGQFYYPGFYAVPPGTVVGDRVELRPNTTLAPSETDTSHPFFSDWWKPDGQGGLAPNKIIQDGFYIQDDNLAGSTVVFSGLVLANTLVAPYGASARAFIVDTFGPDYIFNAVAYVPLVAGQAFSVSLDIPAGHHVAYGIELVGPNARASKLASLGVVQVTAVPELPSAMLIAMGMAGLLLHVRRR